MGDKYAPVADEAGGGAEVKFVTIGGNRFSLVVPDRAVCVSALVGQVAAQQAVPPDRVRLIFRGRVLSAPTTVAEAGIADGDTVHVVFVQNQVQSAPPIAAVGLTGGAAAVPTPGVAVVAAPGFHGQHSFTAVAPPVHRSIYSPWKSRARMWALVCGVLFSMYAFFDFWSYSMLSLIMLAVSLFGATSCYLGYRAFAADDVLALQRYARNLVTAASLYASLQVWNTIATVRYADDNADTHQSVASESRATYITTQLLSIFFFLVSTGYAFVTTRRVVRDILDFAVGAAPANGQALAAGVRAL